MIRVSRFLSYLFHPIFAPLLSVFILFQLPVYLNYKYSEAFHHYIYLLFLLNLIIAPLLISLYFKKKGIIGSLEMPNVKERVIPYLVSGLFYGFTYYLLANINFPALYLEVFRSCCLAITILLVLSIVNFKASAHMTGAGGICGMLIVIAFFLELDITLLLIVFVLISGLLASSRYALRAHSFTELLIGFLIGFGSQLIIL